MIRVKCQLLIYLLEEEVRTHQEELVSIIYLEERFCTQ